MADHSSSLGGRKKNLADDFQAPVGEDFLQLVWTQEDSCEIDTDKLLPTLGRKGPACLRHVGTALSFLDRMASCWWNCRGGDHKIEYACGRAASNSRAVLRLMRFGFYDEAMLVCRALGEVANLMQLFLFDEQTFSDWRSLSPGDAWKTFGPGKVRNRLNGLSVSPVVSGRRYGLLSQRAVHLNPGNIPQAQNFRGGPCLGAFYRKDHLAVLRDVLGFHRRHPNSTVTFDLNWQSASTSHCPSIASSPWTSNWTGLS